MSSDNYADLLDQAALDSLQEMVGGDIEFYAEMIDTFLADAPSLVSEMHAAAQSSDLATLRRSAHTLKSNCRTFGALALSDLCQQIEELAANGTVEAAALLVNDVNSQLADVTAALVAEREATQWKA